jgi:hypothetical protein
MSQTVTTPTWEILARADAPIRLSEAASTAQKVFNLNRTSDRAAEIAFKTLEQAQKLLVEAENG